MSGVPRQTPLEIARCLLEGRGSGAPASAETVQRVCARVTGNLCSIVGNDGCTALLARSLSRVQLEHPALKDLRRLDGDDIYLDAVASAIELHGLPAVTAAVESLLAALVEVLSSLIGADMVLNILDSDCAAPVSETRRES